MKKMNESWPAIPCGLVAKSLFTDTFKLKKKSPEPQNEIDIPINSIGIAWKEDVD